MKRFREGAGGRSFFQKKAWKGMPDWIPTRRFRTHPREGESPARRLPARQRRARPLWMVQMHCIDMNAWYSRVDRPERPDFVLFDLDPPDGGFRLGVRVAHLVRGLLDELGLSSHVKTSGADGVHILVPITRRSTFDDTRDFADGVRDSPRPAPSRPRHDRVAQGKAARRLPRRSPERLGQDDRERLLGPAEARSARFDPAPLGGAHRGRLPAI